ncbi:MAG: hypothetical protein WC887_02005 [Candidatus Paceibacterota bacterium]|jgi:mRNA-degrading endonuclease RelE of RelBE toxin-antitoxin system
MDALDKLFRRVRGKDKILLFEMLRELKNPELRETLDIKKLSGGEFYRVRKGIFRVIFHFTVTGEKVVIDAVRLRNEKTYRGY